MKKILSCFLLLCISMSVLAKEIKQQEYAEIFKGYDACFILYSVNQHKIVSEYNPHNRCNERVAPNSSFKIPLSLMAFDQGIIKQETIFKWDGKQGFMAEHRQDQTPSSWLQYSVVWVSQQIAPKLGYDRIKRYLSEFSYGNQDFSGDPGKNNGVTHAWLSSSLKISAFEQLNFLKQMQSYTLPVSKKAIDNTKRNLYLGKLDNGADYYGKTGSGRYGRNERQSNPSLLREAYFIGFVENGSEKYIFVSNLSDKTVQAKIDKESNLTPYGGQILKPIVVNLLNIYFAI